MKKNNKGLMWIVVLGLIVLGAIFVMKNSVGKIQGTLVRKYGVPGEDPWIATFSDGNYYIFDSEPGAYSYGVSVEKQFENKEHVEWIKDREIIDLKSENGIAAWAEGRPGSPWCVDIKTMNPEGIIRDVYTIRGDEKTMQFPYVAIVSGGVYFTERHADGEKAILWEYDLTAGSMKCVDTIEEYELYKPVICGNGASVVTIGGKQDGRIVLMKYNTLSQEKLYIPLPNTIDLVFGIAYDEASDMYVVYYREAKSGRECIGAFNDLDTTLKGIDDFSGRQTIDRDKIVIQNGYAIWIEHTRPIMESVQMREHKKMVMYSFGKKRVYKREGVVEFCIDGDALYCFEATKEWDRELYKLEWP